MRLTLTLQGRTMTLEIPTRTVFVPNLVGLLNAASLSVRPGETVVDAGTGCGVHAILCALLGAGRVVGCDVNADAVRAARRNAALNGVADRCEFIHGSFEAALARAGRSVGLVVSTLPNTPSGHRYLKESAMRRAPRVARHLVAGEGADALSVRLVAAAAPHLAPGGRLHLHVVDWGDSRPVFAALRSAGLAARLVARAFVPVWGQRCNTISTFRRRALGRPWTVRYADLPRRAGTRVRVYDAARGPLPARPRARHELSVEVAR
jgi:release factor glutamine methyltransferase